MGKQVSEASMDETDPLDDDELDPSVFFHGFWGPWGGRVLRVLPRSASSSNEEEDEDEVDEVEDENENENEENGMHATAHIDGYDEDAGSSTAGDDAGDSSES